MDVETLQNRIDAVIKQCDAYHNGNIETEAWLKHIKEIALGED